MQWDLQRSEPQELMNCRLDASSCVAAQTSQECWKASVDSILSIERLRFKLGKRVAAEGAKLLWTIQLITPDVSLAKTENVSVSTQHL